MMWLSLALASCSFQTVDDACPKNFKGDNLGSDEAQAVVGRINCYRRLAGLDKGNLDDGVTAAVESHSFYMESNGTQSGLEDPSKSGYTGETVWDRFTAHEYTYPTVTGVYVWELVGDKSGVPLGARDLIDEWWIPNIYFRQAMLQPSWVASGFSEVNVDVVHMVVVHDLPARESADQPIVYPADGQLDVPTSVYWTSDPSIRDFSQGQLVGFPITLIVGGDTYADPAIDPYQLQLMSASLSGPGGTEPIVTSTPADNEALRSAVAIIPQNPLEPGETYTLSYNLRWDLGDKEIEEEVTFTTRNSTEAANETLGDFLTR